MYAMYALSRTARRVGVALLAVVAWVTLGAGTAKAKVGPDNAGYTTAPRTVTITTVDWSQLAVTATAACLIGVAASVAVMLVVRHSRRLTSAAPA
jgi:hypothetical protein